MWYVIQVMAGNEDGMREKCRQILPIDVCVRIFAPKFQQMKKYQGMWRSEEKILFPGYLFVDTDNPDEVEKRLTVFESLAKPVCIGGGFYPIRKEEQEFLESILDSNTVVNMSKGYLVDEKLVIHDGPLQDRASHIKKIDRHKRIAELEIALWGEARKVRVGLEVAGKVTADEFEKMMERAG